MKTFAVVVTLQHTNNNSFDILSTRQTFEPSYLFVFDDLAEAKLKIGEITLAYEPEIDLLVQDDNTIQTTLASRLIAEKTLVSFNAIYHFHFNNRGHININCLNTGSDSSNPYEFIDVQSFSNMPEDFVQVLEPLKKKLIKEPVIRDNYGFKGRSIKWEPEPVSTPEKSRGWGVIVNDQYSPITCGKITSHIQTHDPRNPTLQYEPETGIPQTPRGTTYPHLIYALGPYNVVATEKTAIPLLGKRKRKEDILPEDNPPSPKKITSASPSKKSSRLALLNRLREANASLPQEKLPLKVEFTLNKKQLRRVRKEKEANNNQRICNQKDLFGGVSAKKAAELIGLPEGDYEWTHLAAYEFLGAKAQKKENIILSTKALNILHQHLEFLLKQYASQKHKVFCISEAIIPINSKLDDDLKKIYHAAESQCYTIQINDSAPVYFQFDPTSHVIPDQEMFKGMKAALDAALNSSVKFRTPPHIHKLRTTSTSQLPITLEPDETLDMSTSSLFPT